ncbi:MAG: LysR family transcriptional regulator [Phycisphaerae bacterium]|nr:LysR family transcriptional regulator [Phycisphaerae bacterium]
MADLHAHCKLWISSDKAEGSFGTGKVRLLEAVLKTGSLQEAARGLGISYRKAWGDLKKAEACLQCKLIQTTRGGQGGGCTRLTDQGHQVIQAYAVMNDTVVQGVTRAFESFVEDVRAGGASLD